MPRAGVVIDLFAEDRAHELFVSALIGRILDEKRVSARLNVRFALGGHGRAVAELGTYQSAVSRGFAGLTPPDLLVVVIDANCQGWVQARNGISARTNPGAAAETVAACPDPHVERWFFADPEAFLQVVGVDRQPGRLKCERDYYKALLREAVLQAGHPPALAGWEFAGDLVRAMDLYRAGRNEPSLGHLIDALRAFATRNAR